MNTSNPDGHIEQIAPEKAEMLRLFLVTQATTVVQEQIQIPIYLKPLLATIFKKIENMSLEQAVTICDLICDFAYQLQCIRDGSEADSLSIENATPATDLLV